MHPHITCARIGCVGRPLVHRASLMISALLLSARQGLSHSLGVQLAPPVGVYASWQVQKTQGGASEEKMTGQQKQMKEVMDLAVEHVGGLARPSWVCIHRGRGSKGHG